MTTGQRKGVDLGKNLISALCFLKVQISEVMANYHWDDFFSCFVTFPRIDRHRQNKGSDPKPHDGNTEIHPAKIAAAWRGDFLFGYIFQPHWGQKAKNLWRIRNIDWSMRFFLWGALNLSDILGVWVFVFSP